MLTPDIEPLPSTFILEELVILLLIKNSLWEKLSAKRKFESLAINQSKYFKIILCMPVFVTQTCPVKIWIFLIFKRKEQIDEISPALGVHEKIISGFILSNWKKVLLNNKNQEIY